MLSPAQLLIIKNYISADPVLSLLPSSNDGNYEIARQLNFAFAPDFFVWATSVPTKNVFDAITWANLTPQDAPDTTQQWANRSLACQGRQFNIQTILQGRDTVDGSKANIRAGLQDALTSIPSGAAGAAKAGGWPAVKTALTRTASIIEKILAVGTGDATNPAVMGFEGLISKDDVEVARV